MESILEPTSFDPQPDVELLDAHPLPLPPPALDFTKFQEARARFNSAFIDVCSPAFDTVTRTVLPVLQSLQAAVAPLAPAAPLVPSIPQPCALASIPIPINPLAPSSSLHPAIKKHRGSKYSPPPNLEEARRALVSLTLLLGGCRKKGKYKKPFKCDDTTRRRLERMRMLLQTYTNPRKSERLPWIAASLRVARMHGESTAKAESLRKWTRGYMADRNNIPVNLYGKWSASMLDNSDLAKDIFEHLQSVGKYVKAMDVVWYVNKPEVQEKYKLKKGISLATSKRWMSLMDYRWRKTPKGQ
jgi:hypothetical protein